MAGFLLICAVLAFLELDTTYWGQVLISRPIVAGSIIGLLSGNFFLGLQLGIFTELIYLDFMPIGGVTPPSGALSSGIAVIMAQYFGLDIYFAFFVGIIGGLAFSFVEKGLRRLRTRNLPQIEQALRSDKTSAGKIIFQSLLLQFLATYAFLLVCISVIGPAFGGVSAKIPEHLHIAFKFSYFVVPWVGLAGLLLSFSAKPKSD